MKKKRVIQYAAFPQVLKRLMNEKGVTFDEFSRCSGISPSTLHGWVHGVWLENPDNLIALKKAFKDVFKVDFTMEDIIFGNDQDREELLIKNKELEARVQELTMQLTIFQMLEK